MAKTYTLYPIQFMIFVIAVVCHSSDVAARHIPLTIVAVGDINMNRTGVKVRPDGMYLWGRVVPFEKMTKKIAKEINGDINFANLETTVMDRNDIPPAKKKYTFKTHPNAVKLLQEIGFNLFSIANNHIRDYGQQGIKETIWWLKKLSKQRPLYFAGAGLNIDEATKPVVFKVKGVKVAFAAVGISWPATKKRGGVASVYRPALTLRRLRDAKADIRILSIHCGLETKNKPRDVQIRVARLAVKKYNVDLVFGHHSHVVQGIEYYHGGLIFYGLGNFMIRGARNMGAVPEFAIKKDFGLLARIKGYFDTRKRKFFFSRIEAVPVYDMHSGPHRFKTPAQARARIRALNEFSSAKYLGKHAVGIKFAFRDGIGVYVFDQKDGARNAKGQVKKRATLKDKSSKVKMQFNKHKRRRSDEKKPKNKSKGRQKAHHIRSSTKKNTDNNTNK